MSNLDDKTKKAIEDYARGYQEGLNDAKKSDKSDPVGEIVGSIGKAFLILPFALFAPKSSKDFEEGYQKGVKDGKK